MKLGRASRKALAYLLEHGEVGAGDIGGHLWPDRRGHIVAQQGGGDYAAQMLLGRLRKLDLVRTVYGRDGSSLWELTPAARRAMTTPATPATELIAKSSIGQALADVKERGIDAHLADLERGRFK